MHVDHEHINDTIVSMINTNVLGAGAPLTRGVLCVSERHDCFDHHLAQLYTIKQLRKALRQREDRAQVAVGLEAFQRIHQTYLDRYVSADPNYGLNELFRDVDWQQTWGYDPLHYAPILEDARRTGMRLVGLSPPDELLDAWRKQAACATSRARSGRSCLCGNQNFTARSSSTPSTRAPDALVDFHTGSCPRAASATTTRRAASSASTARASTPSA